MVRSKIVWLATATLRSMELTLRPLSSNTGSACSSDAPKPPHVRLAIGLSRQDAFSAIRIGLGRFTKEHEIDKAVEIIVGALERLTYLKTQYT